MATQELIRKIEDLLLEDPETELKQMWYDQRSGVVIMTFTTGERIETDISGFCMRDILWEIIDTVYAYAGRQP